MKQFIQNRWFAVYWIVAIINFTFADSMGDSAMSAKNSADAEAARYSEVLYKKAFSSPMIPE